MTSITSVSSPNKMIASFHNSVLPKIESEPTYASLVEIRDALKENYASIPSRRGRVTFGYLGVILSNAVYDTISPVIITFNTHTLDKRFIIWCSD